MPAIKMWWMYLDEVLINAFKTLRFCRPGTGRKRDYAEIGHQPPNSMKACLSGMQGK